MPKRPTAVSPLMQGVARLLFRITGWVAEGGVLEPRRFVIIAAPHTSNWDAVILVTAAYIFGIRISWFIKDSAFVGPLGWLIRAVGGIPINRRLRQNVVAQAVEEFRRREEFILAVPPEGTRRHSDGWRTGFYYIAREAGVPIVLGYIDYRRKVAGLGRAVVPSGDIDADFEIFRTFYEQVTAKFPENRGVVRPLRSGGGAAEPARAVGE